MKVVEQVLPPLTDITLDGFQEPLIMATFGKPGSGKSRLLGTAPGPVGLLPLERKSRQSVLEAAAESEVRIIAPPVDLIRNDNPVRLAAMPNVCVETVTSSGAKIPGPQIQEAMQEISDKLALDAVQPVCCQRHYFRWHVNRIKYYAFQMAERSNKIRTICIDTCGQFVEDIQYANYGVSGRIDSSEFGFAPREDMVVELRAFFNAIMHKNLILTHHMKPEWKDNKPTGRWVPDTKWNKLGHFCGVMLEMTRDDAAIAFNQLLESGAGGITGEPKPVWGAIVRDCQARPDLIGRTILYDESINFLQIAMQVYPNSEIENWI